MTLHHPEKIGLRKCKVS